MTKIQDNLITTLSLGFIETDCVINGVIMRLFTIKIQQNKHFGSHDMVMLYCKPLYSKTCYNEVELYFFKKEMGYQQAHMLYMSMQKCLKWSEFGTIRNKSHTQNPKYKIGSSTKVTLQ